MRRVVVVGTPGSGKSTVGAALAERLGAPWIELDRLYHLPGWGAPEPEEFRRKVAEALAGARWVVDGNYSAAREVTWARADTVVWLDLPRRVVLRRLARRTFWRVTRRTELWAGNRERWSDVLSMDKHRSILLWAWTQFAVYRRRYGEAMMDPRWSQLRFIRLRSDREVARFVAAQDPAAFPVARWGTDRGPVAAAGRRFVATGAGSAVLRRLVPLDRRVLERSAGRYTLLGPFGVPLLLLTTTGFRSGEPRTTPLVYLGEGMEVDATGELRTGGGGPLGPTVRRIYLAGSNFGGRHHPAWSTNLLRHPEARVTIDGRELAVRARLLEGAARDRVWERFRAVGPYRVYEGRTERVIRVFELVRLEGDDQRGVG